MSDDIALWLTHALYDGILGWPELEVNVESEFFRAVQIATDSFQGPYCMEEITYMSIHDLRKVVEILQKSEHRMMQDYRIRTVCKIIMISIDAAVKFDTHVVDEPTSRKRRRTE